MKLTAAVIKKTQIFVKKIYEKAEKAHSWENHVRFVVNRAKYIAKKEKMNVSVVEMGALFHDVGYLNIRNDIKKMISGDHATPSSKKAEKFMKSLKLDDDVILHVLDTIKYHSGKNIVNAKTREALAVYDADKLDAMGPKGFVRCNFWDLHYETPNANFEEIFNQSIETSKKRIKRVKTKTGKQLAKKYHNYLKEFIKGYKEMNGDI